VSQIQTQFGLNFFLSRLGYLSATIPMSEPEKDTVMEATLLAFQPSRSAALPKVQSPPLSPTQLSTDRFRRTLDKTISGIVITGAGFLTLAWVSLLVWLAISAIRKFI
jgi:hypothetical protein